MKIIEVNEPRFEIKGLTARELDLIRYAVRARVICDAPVYNRSEYRALYTSLGAVVEDAPKA